MVSCVYAPARRLAPPTHSLTPALTPKNKECTTPRTPQTTPTHQNHNQLQLQEMVRDPTTTIHAEDLQAGSSYNIPKLTQQTFGKLRAADEIIDEVRAVVWWWCLVSE